MKFLYLRDPLFLVSLGLFALNRWVFKPNFEWPFLHSFFNDLLCLPVWVPLMLLLARKMGLRKHDDAPDALEILIPFVFWSLIFEGLMPKLQIGAKWGAGDPNDVFFYGLGGVLGWIFWRFFYARRAQN